MSPGQCPSIWLAGDSIDCKRGREEKYRNRHLGLKTWLSFEPEIEVQSPGQNQLGVVEDKVQGNRLPLTRLPTCNLWGYFDTKKVWWESLDCRERRDGEEKEKGR